MENYDLKGVMVIVEEKIRMAVIAVSLPELKKGNAYFIYEIYNISKNKILIHLKDFTGADFSGTGNNLESFIIDLSDSKFGNFEFSTDIEVALCHENNDVLSESPAEVFARAHKPPFPIEKKEHLVIPDKTGTGIICP